MSRYFLKNKFFKNILVFVFVLSVLAAPLQSHAQSLFEGITQAGIAKLVGFYIGIASSVITNLTGTMAQGVTASFSMGISNEAVKSGWGIVRNFANMFFIVALIIMAFATIFGVSKYDFRTLIGRFIFSALLINFSLVIGEMIIGISQSLSNVFLGAIGGLGDRIGQGANVADLLLSSSADQKVVSDWTLQGETTKAIVNLIMLTIVFFSMTVLFFFSWIRIPILWALLVISPVAWITNVFPGNNVWRQWWHYFIGWNIFMPIYLFFVYFGLYFLQSSNSFLGNPGSGAFSAYVNALFTTSLTAMFLIGGAKAAMSSSMVGGAWGAGKIASGVWSRASMFNRSSWTRGAWRSTGIPGAAKESKDYFVKQGFSGTKYENLPIIGGFKGQRGLEERQARIAGGLGIPGVAEKQLSNNVAASSKKIKDKGAHLNRGALEAMIISGTPEEKIAAAQLFTEENYGALNPDQVKNVIEAFGGNINTSLAASTLRKIKWNEMPADDLRKFIDPSSPTNINDSNIRSLIYNALIERRRATLPEFEAGLSLTRSSQQKANMIAKAKDLLGDDLSAADRQTLLSKLTDTDSESKRELVKIMAQKGDKFFHDSVGDPIQAELSKYADLFENPGERKAFLENVAKKNADNVAQEMLTRKMFKDDAGNVITDTQEGLKRVLSKLSIEEKLTQDSSQYLRPHFQQALAADMSKNINTLEKYLKDDKYVAASPKIQPAENMARNTIYASQFLEPFAVELRRANELLRKMRSTPYNKEVFDQYTMQSRDLITELTGIRRDYERLCRKNNILDANTREQVKRFDESIDKLKSRVSAITDQAKSKPS